MVTHPNTITVLDYGRTTDGVFYYATELLEGASLDELVRLVQRSSSSDSTLAATTTPSTTPFAEAKLGTPPTSGCS